MVAATRCVRPITALLLPLRSAPPPSSSRSIRAAPAPRCSDGPGHGRVLRPAPLLLSRTALHVAAVCVPDASHRSPRAIGVRPAIQSSLTVARRRAAPVHLSDVLRSGAEAKPRFGVKMETAMAKVRVRTASAPAGTTYSVRGRRCGRLILTRTLQKEESPAQITIVREPANEGAAGEGVPRNFNVDIHTVAEERRGPLVVLSENRRSGALAFEGVATRMCLIMPATQSDRSILRSVASSALARAGQQRGPCRWPTARAALTVRCSRSAEQRSKRPRTEILESPAECFRPVAQHESERLEEQQRQDSRRLAMPHEDLKQMLFKLFAKNQYYTFRDLQDLTHQPTDVLKRALREIAVHNKRGEMRDTWQLKAEIQTRKA